MFYFFFKYQPALQKSVNAFSPATHRGSPLPLPPPPPGSCAILLVLCWQLAEMSVLHAAGPQVIAQLIS
jgi:hypothetical protein